jgi:hypothetical protein
MWFEDPEDFLHAEEVSEAIASQAKWYFHDDQIGKSWDVLQVIIEYAEECGLAHRRDKSSNDDPVETCEVCGPRPAAFTQSRASRSWRPGCSHVSASVLSVTMR